MSFVYKIEFRQAPNILDKSGASFQFIVGKEKLNYEPSNLIGNNLWIVVEENKKSFLTEFGRIETISVIETGTHKGDLVIELDHANTFKTTNATKAKSRWVLPNGDGLTLGFNTCSEEQERVFEGLIRSNFACTWRF